ncbi:MAG: hypothetical protein WC683_02270 [bacterium]
MIQVTRPHSLSADPPTVAQASCPPGQSLYYLNGQPRCAKETSTATKAIVGVVVVGFVGVLLWLAIWRMKLIAEGKMPYRLHGEHGDMNLYLGGRQG